MRTSFASDSHHHGPPRTGIFSKISIKKRYFIIIAIIVIIYVAYNFVFFDTILNRSAEQPLADTKVRTEPIPPAIKDPARKKSPPEIPNARENQNLMDQGMND
jgi:hypothetical protein